MSTNKSNLSEEKYLNPKNDVVFKKIVSHEDCVIDFLNAILGLSEGEKIIEVQLLNTDNKPNYIDDKHSICDFKCLDQKQKHYIVTIHLSQEISGLKPIQYYLTSAYAEQMHKTYSYNDLLPVIIISINDYNVLDDDEKCISIHTMRSKDTNKSYFKDFIFVFVELLKFNTLANGLQSDKDYWLYFFTNWDYKKEPPKTISNSNVLKAYDLADKFNWTAEEYKAYKDAEQRLTYFHSQLDGYFIEGKAEGIAEEKLRSVRIMKEKGYPIDDIISISCLTKEEIEKEIEQLE